MTCGTVLFVMRFENLFFQPSLHEQEGWFRHPRQPITFAVTNYERDNFPLPSDKLLL